MRKYLGVVPALVAVMLLSTAAVAPAAERTSSAAAAKPSATQARAGGIRIGAGRSAFGRRSPVVSRRGARGARPRAAQRPISGRRVIRGVLQVLGIAYLAQLLFGVGPGGSPLGLILLGLLLFWAVTRSRRRIAAYPRAY